MRRRVARSFLPLLLCGVMATVARAAPPAPAIGYDWMDPPDPDTASADPDPWPRADAADSGLDDMIHAERRPLEAAIAPAPARPETTDRHILRTLRKVGGDYVVVPVLTLHLDRDAAR